MGAGSGGLTGDLVANLVLLPGGNVLALFLGLLGGFLQFSPGGGGLDTDGVEGGLVVDVYQRAGVLRQTNYHVTELALAHGACCEVLFVAASLDFLGYVF